MLAWECFNKKSLACQPRVQIIIHDTPKSPVLFEHSHLQDAAAVFPGEHSLACRELVPGSPVQACALMLNGDA